MAIATAAWALALSAETVRVVAGAGRLKTISPSIWCVMRAAVVDHARELDRATPTRRKYGAPLVCWLPVLWMLTCTGGWWSRYAKEASRGSFLTPAALTTG